MCRTQSKTNKLRWISGKVLIGGGVRKERAEKRRYFPGNGGVSAGLYFTISRIYSRRIAPRQSARI